MTTPNVPLLRKAVEWVEEQDQLPWQERAWKQSTWLDNSRRPAFWEYDFLEPAAECGTACCVAGFLAMENGWSIFVDLTAGPIQSDTYFHKDGKSLPPEQFGAEILRITPKQALELFASGNEAEDIRNIAEDITGERL